MSAPSLFASPPFTPCLSPYSASFDITREVDLSDWKAVLSVISAIFNRRFGDEWPRTVLVESMTEVAQAFAGDYPGLLVCDTPYHDLRHTLDATLTTARMIDGHEGSILRCDKPLGGDLATIGVLLALFHDFGYLRRSDEAHLIGAQLVVGHEDRGAAFAADFMCRNGLETYAPLARLIKATAFKENLEDLFSAYSGNAVALGRMMASADVLCQLADRFYLERCRDFLYLEFVDGGLDRVDTGDGATCILYTSAEDLLRKTPWFFESVIMKRLEYDMGGVYRYLDDHFGGQNPYVKSMFANIDFLKDLVDTDNFSRLRRNPQPLYSVKT